MNENERESRKEVKVKPPMTEYFLFKSSILILVGDTDLRTDSELYVGSGHPAS